VKARRWLAHPVLSLLLAASWLLLQQSVAVSNLITAAVLGLGVPRLLDALLGPATPLRSVSAVVRLTAIVLWDIVVSNITVARIVLTPWSRPQPAWVVVPLDTQHPVAIALFATIITNTPGTVSCVVDAERREILVHALDCTDTAAAAVGMKQRYERLIMEIIG
jgi:multicomponent K+:H+ antiporter subunit E